MRHATDTDLDAIEALLSELRTLPGLRERKRGYFSRGSRAFAHFHEHAGQYYADVRFGASFERLRVTTAAEQAELIERTRRALDSANGRQRAHRSSQKRSAPRPPTARPSLRSLIDSKYSVKALDESTLPAFAALVEQNNGVFGGCWCIGFHPEGVDRTSPAVNRKRKFDRVRAGTAHAALVFDGDICVGWCQFGAPDEVPRIKSRAAYEKTQQISPDWRIACCFVGKGHRRAGVATAALTGAIDLIALLGGGVVEGYPEDARSVPAGFLFNGALSTYEKLGFVRERKIGKHRWVVTRVVAPKPRGAKSRSSK